MQFAKFRSSRPEGTWSGELFDDVDEVRDDAEGLLLEVSALLSLVLTLSLLPRSLPFSLLFRMRRRHLSYLRRQATSKL